MKYKLLLLDVDGTLIQGKEERVSEQVASSVKNVSKEVHISLCTGRAHKDIRHIVEKLDVKNSYHVIESGAKVLNPKGKEERIKDIPFSDVKALVEQAGDTPQGYGFCVSGEWHDKLETIPEGIITTVSLHSYSKEQTEAITKSIKPFSKKYHITLGSHWTVKDGNFILITNLEASKGKAIKYVQEKLGIRKEETICVGDMPNDLAMFEQCGFRVAMGNGHDDLKAEADFIAPSITEDGVSNVIKKFLSS